MSGRFPILYIAEADPEEAILSSGALAHLVEMIPHADFTVVGSAASAPLFADLPRLRRLLVLDRDGRWDWISLWNQVRNTNWGLVVDMRGSTVSGKLRRQRRAVKQGSIPGIHAVEEAARLLQLDEIPAPKLFISEATQAIADSFIPRGDEPILAIGPGVDWIGKRWPAERYAKVAAPLLAEGGPLAGGRLMIVGEEADRDAAHTIRFAVRRDRVIELQGKLTRLQTAAALRHANLFIGGDSVWTQLAVAAGVPAVGVFGPSDDTKRRPWTGIAVRGPRTLEEYKELDPRLNQHIQHMMDLPADRVLKKTLKMLAEMAE
ncbi:MULTISPECIES: glycosyltransferase family 9 protein [unclassified Brevundimonas]|uniref:glycosyltransferase family 9 protein n=1 Tax=unclassified Brevundimonas TaxID=2622653 RepID=UPI0025B8968D|nr:MULTISPECIES: glycosyltransferase family 9 protein [unclassified Brevundimonas]